MKKEPNIDETIHKIEQILEDKRRIMLYVHAGTLMDILALLKESRQQRNSFTDTAKTATIRYLPVCTNCNTIIWDKIDYKEPNLEIEQNSRHFNYSALHKGEVQPRKCVNCGAIFTNIEIPTKLPFDNRKETNGI